MPLDGADKVAGSPVKKSGRHTVNNMEVCALCPIHMKEYLKHVDSYTCAAPECDRFGTALPTHAGAKRLRVDRAKELTLSDHHADRARSPPPTRGWSTKGYVKPTKKDNDIPDLDVPPIEPIPPKVEVNRWPNPSGSLSTRSTNSLFGGKLKDIGGRLRGDAETSSVTKKVEQESLSLGGSSDRHAPVEHSDERHHAHPSKAHTVKIERKHRNRKGSSSPRSLFYILYEGCSRHPVSSSESSPISSVGAQLYWTF